jgi:hypothetical protein
MRDAFEGRMIEQILEIATSSGRAMRRTVETGA